MCILARHDGGAPHGSEQRPYFQCKLLLVRGRNYTLVVGELALDQARDDLDLAFARQFESYLIRGKRDLDVPFRIRQQPGKFGQRAGWDDSLLRASSSRRDLRLHHGKAVRVRRNELDGVLLINEQHPRQDHSGLVCRNSEERLANEVAQSRLRHGKRYRVLHLRKLWIVLCGQPEYLEVRTRVLAMDSHRMALSHGDRHVVLVRQIRKHFRQKTGGRRERARLCSRMNLHEPACRRSQGFSRG